VDHALHVQAFRRRRREPLRQVEPELAAENAKGARSGSIRFPHTVLEDVAQKAEILESISDAFLALDHDFRFTYVNAAAEKLLNMRARDLIGRDHWEVFPAAVGQPLERDYRRAMAERKKTARRLLPCAKPATGA
jgi:PAS domain-containing protein